MSRLPLPAAPLHAENPVAAADALEDPDVVRVLASRPREVPRARQVYCNRNLRMDQIELVGFDMDYTLAIYHAERIERLSFELTVRKMIHERAYPEKLARI